MTAFSEADHHWMSRAIALAGKGQFTTSPNPAVGCVILDSDGNLAGEGYHRQAGGPHAEVFALRQAGDRARGGTAYVTLEPCSHHGRTPPCAEALIEAGIKRVIAAGTDPNPKVSGKGLALLQNAGIAAEHGLLETDAEALNRGFMTRMRTGKPFVTLKLAASLDGKTALENGHSQWVTSEAARLDVQRHRASACAILTGSGTVLIDNPSLNVRLTANALGLEDDLGVRQPLRVIVDSRNQMQPDLTLFTLPGEILLANKKPNHWRFDSNVSQWQCHHKTPRVHLPALLNELGQRGVNHLWVESGAALAGALLQQHLVDELMLYQAPKLMGDKAKGLCLMPSLSHMNEALSLSWSDIRQVGEDLRLTARVLPQNQKK
ncbi:Diaminohydroxyphosphoribosylaminopyrimidine deaminase [Saliniradius amylolyticus]|uniref:Riboflavin biosynthesis protein RibD n=1 Tax=Saliniradius amylolyticus TaxID=2183582 RepID=A0A2S2E2D3_9ALTE|nr:bifunctional diaminohydroxyphosphoribosylaminopyrimidine deaminase/5-amino-6-(5-phosphoribosylamino)uracil reductase RibD [Saliniradius amylolyticus]AWL11420.1 Diaminohydroxyphosphoribosylaminopyrimidine deaminase [Saliniradius amylolyticus]